MAKRPAPSAAILSIALEMLAVGVFTLLAGAGEEAGSIVVLFMVGLWIMYLISDSQIVQGLVNMLNTLSTNPSNS